ncbi:MAG: hypothetical protein K2U26_06950 [Cyclobacteriaceae bacterium]|nr:hypothetical protein [Cyclobacteriaceae bacterium]
MNATEAENLFIRSLDEDISEAERQQLSEALRSHDGLAQQLEKHRTLRERMVRKDNASFGPYFAQKVINRIQSLRTEIDDQIVFFFRKYQLAAIGIFVALLAINILFAEQVDVASVLGLQEASTVSADEDVLSFDFLQPLTNE